MREGFLGLVPAQGMEFLDWAEAERLVCGTPTIDVDLLKRITSYKCAPPPHPPPHIRGRNAHQETAHQSRGGLTGVG